MTEESEYVSWYTAVVEDPEYYTHTEQGQRELADMIRKESERLIEELGKSVKRTKEIIWLSRFCSSCRYFQTDSRKMSCNRWGVRIVKPFYGTPVWGMAPSTTMRGEKEPVVEGINWDEKWKEISDKIVSQAVEMVNGGYPYFCYSTR